MSKDTVTFRIRELDPDMIAPPTKNMNKPEQGGSKIVIIGKPGCFTKGTPVMMYDGTLKNVEDIKVADVVMGDDCTPRIVQELCFGKENMYRIRHHYDDEYDTYFLYQNIALEHFVVCNHRPSLHHLL